MKIAKMIQNAMDARGYKNLKNASKAMGISPELLRVIVNKGHIPKDATLALIAKKLNMDMPSLVLAAHQERVPMEVKGFFLRPSLERSGRQKRKYPLSEEQTAYLNQVLTEDEIMLLRKIRQVNDTTRSQISGFVDFMYSTKRVA